MRDFFISYNRADKKWAEWIAWVLEEAQYSVFIQAWDFRPGGNFILDMQRAARDSRKTIAVLSETYLKSAFTQPEWAAAVADDPSSLARKLIPIKVKACKPDGLLSPIVYVDLIGSSAADAKQKLLDAMRERAKPDHVDFPGESQASDTTTPRSFSEPITFPTALTRLQEIQSQGLQQRFDALAEQYTSITKAIVAAGGQASLETQQQLQQLATEMESLEIQQDRLSEPDQKRQLSPGTQLKLDDLKEQKTELEERVQNLNAQIKEALDPDMITVLKRRKEKAFADIDAISQEILEIEQSNG